MADDLDDDVFVLENGIITNQNVPLILHDDLEGGGGIAGFGLGDEFPDFDAANANQIVHDDLGGNLPGIAQEDDPGFPGMAMPQNGVQQSVSSSPQSSAQSSSSVAFEQGEVLGSSTPAFEAEPGCYVNPSYQSSVSDLSEFNPSVEIQPGTGTVTFKDLSKSTPGTSGVKENSGESKASQSSGLSENKATRETGNIAQASTSTLENSEAIMPNPPNSPADFGRCLSRSGSATRLLRRYRDTARLRVHQLNHPARPSSFFKKFGSCLLILVFVLPLAMVACVEGLLPWNSLTVFLILWGLSIIGSIGCYIKVVFSTYSGMLGRAKSVTRKASFQKWLWVNSKD